MIYFRIRAAVSKICFTMMLLFVAMLCWQYIFVALWNGSEFHTAAQTLEVSDGEDAIKPEGQLLNGPSLNTESSHAIQGLRKILDGTSHKIESPPATGNIISPSDVVETKPADTSLMRKRVELVKNESPSATLNIKSPDYVVEKKPADASLMGKHIGLWEIGTKPKEVSKVINLSDELDLADKNKKPGSKKTKTDHDSNLTASSPTAIHTTQPITSNTVNFEGSIHSHAERNQVLKAHPSAIRGRYASSSAKGREPETKSDRTSAEVMQPSTLDKKNSIKSIEPETNDSTRHKFSDHSRPPTSEQVNSTSEKITEKKMLENDLSDIFRQSTSDQNDSKSGNKPETNASGDEYSHRPRAIILWSYWRSGSTFVADLLANTLPNNTFYSFEPLFRYGKRLLRKEHEPQTQEAVSFLKDLLKCDLRAHKDYVVDNSKLSFMLYANPYLSRRCAKVDKCGDVETFSRTCLSARVHIAKITRLSAQYAKAFLEDPQFEDLQIVYLLRDPRAIMWSRLGNGQRGHPWCSDPTNPRGDQETDKVCSDHKTFCRLLGDDIKMSQAIWANHKKRFFALRYEDMSFRPKATVESLWEALNLPVTDTFLRYLDQATTGHKPTNQRTDSTRHSHNHTFKWRMEAPWNLIHKVQQECSEVIQQLGFKMFKSEEELRDMTFPASVGSDW